MDYRARRAVLGDIAWASMSMEIPGEAFHMLKLSVFLCNFIGYTSGRRLPSDLDLCILRPLLQSSSHRLLFSGSESDYPAYRTHGSGDLGIVGAHSTALSQNEAPFGCDDYSMTPLPMGYTGE
jgi:hypothetical protein